MVRCTDRPPMTMAVDLGREATKLWPFSSLPLIQEGFCQLQEKVGARITG